MMLSSLQEGIIGWGKFGLRCNDGSVVITDAVGILLFLFGSGADPAAPGPADQPCGQDPDAPNSAGDLGCNAYTGC